jgi:hypothetical protein
LAEANIQHLCFTKHGPLVNEFEYIFTDIFLKRSSIYKHIVETLALGVASQDELSKKTGFKRTGDLSEYLNELVLSGFICRDYTWNLKTGLISKLSYYRLKDNYVRFYLKYILPNKPKIETGVFENRSIASLPGWDTIMDLQFENLVLNNHHMIIQLLGVHREEVVFWNPFFQIKTNRYPGCQIDYLLQTRFNSVYLCEIKYSRSEIGPEIISEMEKKTSSLKLPKNFSYRPVLTHVNGVGEEVVDSGYFSNIIDFSQLLDG